MIILGDMLSQAEINALLNGTAPDNNNITDSSTEDLTPQEIDALGEIGNICMGSSATTLFTLLGQKVTITTPKVTMTTLDEIAKEYSLPIVVVKVEYTKGLMGSNYLILKEDDAKIIINLMMGENGTNVGDEFNDLHLSAIGEAMNQMIGSSATSMSSMFDKKIEISPPKAFSMNFGSGQQINDFDNFQKIVRVAFRMIIGNLIDSEIMQLIPFSFAKNLVDNLLDANLEAQSIGQMGQEALQASQQIYSQPKPIMPQQGIFQNEQYFGHNNQNENLNQDGQHDYSHSNSGMQKNKPNINVQPAQFQSFDEGKIVLEKKNISLIMDVLLQVTVELGRTKKLIKDILEFGAGSIIELDKLAGEPVDILVNGKPIAKGEVVVIDESFGVRIIDIIDPTKRL